MLVDLLICSLPSGVINRPPAAPALLKACAESAGFSVRTEDLSLNFYLNQCDENFNRYYEQIKFFEPYNKFESTDLIAEWIRDFEKLIRDLAPTFVAFSVFSTFQHRATVILCQRLRTLFPDIKIILGGYGLPEPVADTFFGFMHTDFKNFDQFMQFSRLVDHCIYGEGEQSLVDVLAGQPLMLEPVDMNDVPVPNFDDYRLDKYVWHTVPVLTVTSSKGCVRSCTFCNVPRKFGRFRRKSGQGVAHELIQLSQRYNITKFEFTDSLVNGSQKDFYEWVSIVADYNNQQAPDKKITWYGQYICRPQSQVPRDIYAKIKQSGAVNLIIGAESGSDAVLEAMQKKMTVQDIFQELNQFELHGIQAQLLLLNGFYNETWERYLETLQFIVRCHRYLAAGTIGKIAMGPPLMIEPSGYLHQHAEQLGIVINPNNTHEWTTTHDASNTWLERVRRHIIAQVLLDVMGTSMTSNGIEELHLMLNQIQLYETQSLSLDSSTDTRPVEFSVH